MSAAMLSVEQLAFAWPGLPLFRDWSCDFAPGLTWVRGDNGCGKSTLLRLLGGSLDPRSGSIRYAGFDAQADPLDYRRHVYWCGPDGPAFDHLKPLEFFGFIAGLYPGFDTAMPAALIESLGLAPFLERRIGQLSTGSRKKVAVVAALSAGTPVVLLDEPLAALDRASSTVIKRHLAAAAIQRDRVWIVTSHEPLGDDVVPTRLLDLPLRS
jgi:ABC-type multidrug transport system ATPase subunit